MPTAREQLRRLRARVAREAHRPVLPRRPGAAQLASWVIPPEMVALAERVHIDDCGHGYDRFGMSRDGVAMGLAITQFLYERWFRVSSHGAEHVPATGPTVLAANHSGTLPLDGLMIWADLVRGGGQRVPRVVVDHFVPGLPFVNTVFTRGGAVGGSRGNFHALLDAGELIVVFPEGVAGIGKPFAERYKLQRFREGHAELAIRHQAPVVPVAVIGAEEQMPQIARIERLSLFGAPYLPITLTPLPMPVHYHLWYGEPIEVAGRFAKEDAQDAVAVQELAAEVQAAVAALVAQGLEQRAGVFA